MVLMSPMAVKVGALSVTVVFDSTKAGFFSILTLQVMVWLNVATGWNWKV